MAFDCEFTGESSSLPRAHSRLRGDICEGSYAGLTEGRERFSPVDTPDERYTKTVQVSERFFL